MHEVEQRILPPTPPARPRNGRATIAEVAAMAGVSATTVSHVFSGKRVVSAATRQQVLEAVDQLGYRPNHVARNLRTRRSHMVAAIVPDITNPFYGVLTRGLADALEEAGYGTFVCNTDGLVKREERFLEDVLDRGVDAVVMAAVNVPPQTIVELADTGNPFVCVGAEIESPHVDRLVADDEGGSRAITEHLLSRGARRVAMIHGPDTSGSSRVAGYRQALEGAGVPFDPALVTGGDWTRQGGREAMHRLMAAEPAPDTVFCANDLMAIGAMDAARELGLDIPGDVALAGFDDIDAAALVNPTLTTVRNPSYEAGRAAGELLLSRLAGEHTAGQRTVVLPCSLVLRSSG